MVFHSKSLDFSCSEESFIPGSASVGQESPCLSRSIRSAVGEFTLAHGAILLDVPDGEHPLSATHHGHPICKIHRFYPPNTSGSCSRARRVFQHLPVLLQRLRATSLLPLLLFPESVLHLAAKEILFKRKSDRATSLIRTQCPPTHSLPVSFPLECLLFRLAMHVKLGWREGCRRHLEGLSIPHSGVPQTLAVSFGCSSLLSPIPYAYHCLISLSRGQFQGVLLPTPQDLLSLVSKLKWKQSPLLPHPIVLASPS